MKKNYRVFITNGLKMDSFTMLGNSKSDVKELCNIVHTGTGWNVSDVRLVLKKDRL